MMRQIAVRTHLMALSWVQHTQPITAGELQQDSLKNRSFCLLPLNETMTLQDVSRKQELKTIMWEQMNYFELHVCNISSPMIRASQ